MSEPQGAAPERLPLRERKKLHTRRVIADAAFALALEHGLEGVLVEDIAERAFVSPRTLSNYFPAKEAAIVAAGEQDLSAIGAAIRGRPVDEAPITAVRHVLTTAMTEWSPERLDALRAKERLVDAHPALLPYRMVQYDALEDAVRHAVADRLGVDADTEAAPRLVAGAATTAVKTAIRVWVLQDRDEPTIADLLGRAFDELESGLAAH